jgi:hypothetical protein
MGTCFSDEVRSDSSTYQHTSCYNYHHMYVTVLFWVKIQFDRKQIPFKYKTRKKKKDRNNGKEKVPKL